MTQHGPKHIKNGNFSIVSYHRSNCVLIWLLKSKTLLIIGNYSHYSFVCLICNFDNFKKAFRFGNLYESSNLSLSASSGNGGGLLVLVTKRTTLFCWRIAVVVVLSYLQDRLAYFCWELSFTQMKVYSASNIWICDMYVFHFF